jgi:hypothetical protein
MPFRGLLPLGHPAILPDVGVLFRSAPSKKLLSVAQAPVLCRRCRDLRTMVSAAGARELGPVCGGRSRPDQSAWMGVSESLGGRRGGIDFQCLEFAHEFKLMRA